MQVLGIRRVLVLGFLLGLLLPPHIRQLAGSLVMDMHNLINQGFISQARRCARG